VLDSLLLVEFYLRSLEVAACS